MLRVKWKGSPNEYSIIVIRNMYLFEIYYLNQYDADNKCKNMDIFPSQCYKMGHCDKLWKWFEIMQQLEMYASTAYILHNVQ